MTNQKQFLAEKAKQKVIDIRRATNLGLKSPICIYDLCDKLKIRVRFVDISMEGMYFRDAEPLIMLSSLRPLPRRTFTCAHELGHHVFGHGSTIDELLEEMETDQVFRPDEFLVNSFAGFMLMPILGIRKAFSSRGWNANSATPDQFFTVACNFGVGYETLITHMTYSLKELSPSRSILLLKTKPKAIREKILGRPSANPLIIADKYWSMPTIDAEVGSQLLLPAKVKPTSDVISFEENHSQGSVFKANRPGIVRIYSPRNEWSIFVRISCNQFTGLSKYRHLEEAKDEQ